MPESSEETEYCVGIDNLLVVVASDQAEAIEKARYQFFEMLKTDALSPGSNIMWHMERADGIDEGFVEHAPGD